MTVGESTGGAREALIEIEDLVIEFRTDGGWIPVVRGGSLRIDPGTVHALVGESGSGKTVTALSILGLLPRGSGRIARGSIRLEGRELTSLSEPEIRRIRGAEIGMIFQEPMTSLNPAFTIGEQIAETVRRHLRSGRRQAWSRAVEVLDQVGIPAAARRAHDYPHNFSGGMRQRAMIAMAIACKPKCLIADEPTTALDVTVQAGILRLLDDLRTSMGMSVLLVTHDLGVVARFAHDLTVMYAGEPVEVGRVAEVLRSPRHPYTQGLLRSLPQNSPLGSDLYFIPGRVPRPGQMPPGCAFAPRCEFAVDDPCTAQTAHLVATEAGRASRCVRVQRGDPIMTAGGLLREMA